jgi:hypothetical protein
MGAITELLNTLGYGNLEEKTTTISFSRGNDDQVSASEGPDHLNLPKGYISSSACVGCELSARYF